MIVADDPGPLHYDRTTITLHWLTAGLVAFQWIGAQTIDFFPRGALRVDARSVHILACLLLTGVLIVRLCWRLTRGRRLPPAGSPPIHFLAWSVHIGLYLALVAMVMTGIFLEWTRGDSIFNLFAVPKFAPGDRTLSEVMQERHALIGWIIVGLVGLHASAALFHRYYWRDGVLGRMLPSRWSA